MKKVLFTMLVCALLVGCDSRSGGNRSVYSPTFTGSDNSSSGTYVIRTVPTCYSDGTPAGYYEVVQRGAVQYVRRVNGTQEYNFNEDFQNGFNYVFWNGAAWLYFY